VDSTGLEGVFDFEFDMDSRPRGGGATSPDSPTQAADDSASTIFEAMRQLGLKLELRRRPMSVIVIDQAERVAQSELVG
jgi:uncharacterized protein (TIGR03435 family)